MLLHAGVIIQAGVQIGRHGQSRNQLLRQRIGIQRRSAQRALQALPIAACLIGPIAAARKQGGQRFNDNAQAAPQSIQQAPQHPARLPAQIPRGRKQAGGRAYHLGRCGKSVIRRIGHPARVAPRLGPHKGQVKPRHAALCRGRFAQGVFAIYPATHRAAGGVYQHALARERLPQRITLLLVILADDVSREPYFFRPFAHAEHGRQILKRVFAQHHVVARADVDAVHVERHAAPTGGLQLLRPGIARQRLQRALHVLQPGTHTPPLLP